MVGGFFPSWFLSIFRRLFSRNSHWLRRESKGEERLCGSAGIARGGRGDQDSNCLPGRSF